MSPKKLMKKRVGVDINYFSPLLNNAQFSELIHLNRFKIMANILLHIKKYHKKHFTMYKVSKTF